MSSRHSLLHSVLLAIAAAAGCASESMGGQTGEEGSGCVPVQSTALASDERSALGVSAEQVVAGLGAEHRGQLTYDDGTATPVRIAFAYAGGEIAFVEHELRDEQRQERDGEVGAEPALEPAAECQDLLRVAGTLDFETEDGAFDETWNVHLDADSPTTASVLHEIDLDALHGSFQVTQLDPDEWGEVDAFLSVRFRDGAPSGSLFLQAISGGGSNPNDSVSAQHFAIASF
jgi:hypothetical protein